MTSRAPFVRSLAVLVLGIALAAPVLAADGEPPPTDEVLFRANQWLADYLRTFSDVVCDEAYVQAVIDESGREKEVRTLASEYLLVRVPEEDGWVGFRDVFQVDGRPVSDRTERLHRLFLERPEQAFDRARAVAKESARYNIGWVSRTINVPTLALLVVHPLHQYRFAFEKTGEEAVEGLTVWIVTFTEQRRPTLVRTGRRDVFARGRLWIDPQSGRIVRTELTTGDSQSGVRSQITVHYSPDPAIGTWVPVRMEETYEDPQHRTGDRIEAIARYSNVRRFGVLVDQAIRMPQPK